MIISVCGEYNEITRSNVGGRLSVMCFRLCTYCPWYVRYVVINPTLLTASYLALHSLDLSLCVAPEPPPIQSGATYHLIQDSLSPRFRVGASLILARL